MVPAAAPQSTAPVTEPVAWPLLDPWCISDGMAQGSCATAVSVNHGGRRAASIASGDTSRLKGVNFYFQARGGTLVLQTSRLEMPDEYGTRPIKFFAQVVSTHHQFVLLRICCSDDSSPTDFFIYSFPFWEKGATVAKLPEKIAPEIKASPSFCLLRDSSNDFSKCQNFVVANLEIRFNTKIGRVEAFLDRCWWCSSSSTWSSKPREPVRVTLPYWIDLGKWKTHKVVHFGKTLLWIDYRQGILQCSNPLHKDDPEAKFNFLFLPEGLLCSQVFHYLLWESKGRPEMFLSFGCCNGKLNFVRLNNLSDVNTVVVTIMALRQWTDKGGLTRQCWDQISQISLDCTKLWSAMKTMLQHSSTLHLPGDWEVSGYHMPCFPVPSKDKNNILYLTMAREDNKRAWLLQVNTNSGDLVGVADFPGFCDHQRPPHYGDCF